MLGALDLLRRLGWAVIDFIYNLIDTLFNILTLAVKMSKPIYNKG